MKKFKKISKVFGLIVLISFVWAQILYFLKVYDLNTGWLEIFIQNIFLTITSVELVIICLLNYLIIHFLNKKYIFNLKIKMIFVIGYFSSLIMFFLIRSFYFGKLGINIYSDENIFAVLFLPLIHSIIIFNILKFDKEYLYIMIEKIIRHTNFNHVSWKWIFIHAFIIFAANFFTGFVISTSLSLANVNEALDFKKIMPFLSLVSFSIPFIFITIITLIQKITWKHLFYLCITFSLIGVVENFFTGLNAFTFGGLIISLIRNVMIFGTGKLLADLILKIIKKIKKTNS